MSSFSLMMHKKNGQSGVSLVELMVAMLISLFLVGGAISLLSQNRVHYRQNNDQLRLQESARFALDIIAGDLRMAGYTGCSRSIANNLSGIAPGDLLDTRNTALIDGYEQNSSSWSAQPSNDIVDRIYPGTDAITIRKVTGKGAPISASMANAADNVMVENAPVDAGFIGAIYDCETANIFQVTFKDNQMISHASGGSFSPGNVEDAFHDPGEALVPRAYVQSPFYTADPDADKLALKAITFVSRFDAIRYFIADTDPDGEVGYPSLWREYHNGTEIVTEEFIQGVENMQILYGLDDDVETNQGDGVPDRYVKANEIPAVDLANRVNPWKAVVAVKISLLVRSLDETGSSYDEKTYDIYSTPDDPTDDIGPFYDRRSRTIISTTVMIMNRNLDSNPVMPPETEATP